MTQTTSTETTGQTPCTCGCGFATKTPEARYIAGHDAKHVSKLVEQFISLTEADASPEGLWHSPIAARDLHLALEAELPTDALKAKFNRAMHNRINREFDRWSARDHRANAMKSEAARDAAHAKNTIPFGWHPDDYAATFTR